MNCFTLRIIIILMETIKDLYIVLTGRAGTFWGPILKAGSAADVPWNRLGRQLKRSAPSRAVIPPAPEPRRDHAHNGLPPSPLRVQLLVSELFD